MAHTSSLNATEVASYCGSKPGAAATRPFGPEPLVFKVSGKMFALIGTHNGEPVVSLKCDPDRALVLRSSFASITAGYHLNKEHWNTLVLDGSLPAPFLRDQVDHSYELVIASPRKSGKRGARRAAAPRRKRPRAR